MKPSRVCDVTAGQRFMTLPSFSVLTLDCCEDPLIRIRKEARGSSTHARTLLGLHSLHSKMIFKRLIFCTINIKKSPYCTLRPVNIVALLIDTSVDKIGLLLLKVDV